MSKVKVITNLYEIGIKGYFRVSGDVVSIYGISPCIRARTQGDMPLIVEDEDNYDTSYLTKRWKYIREQTINNNSKEIPR